jgi:uncharacterized damage-inducible protein DinB
MLVLYRGLSISRQLVKVNSPSLQNGCAGRLNGLQCIYSVSCRKTGSMRYSINDGFPYYIELLGDKDYVGLFHSKENLNLLGSLSEEQAAYRYAPGKWSIKQVIGHITDHERIMTYRALRFSRRDKTPLPGYDQNTFVDNSRFDELAVSQLVTDLENVRNASISFLNSLSREQLALTGTAWKYELPVESFLKATIGHELHHMDIIKRLYLPAVS